MHVTQMRRRPGRRALVALGILASAAFIATGCGDDDSGNSKSDNADAPVVAEWLSANGNYANTRVASSSKIDASNVADLAQTWTTPIKGSGPFGAFASFPLVDEDGTAYIQDLASNVYAYDLETGEQKWAKMYNAPSIGPNGLAYEDGVLFGVTNDDVFAIDAATGEEQWNQNILKYEFGIAEGQNLGFTIQPAVKDGVVYLSEAAKAGGGNSLALDAKTGESKWKFDTTENPESDQTASGGSWNTPAIDEDGNVYFSVANGYYSPNSPKSTQNERLYTDSVIKLGQDDGKLDWYYQGITNDFWDWDMHLSPILTEVDGTDAVVSSGKMGVVYAMDRKTGKEIWQTPVGTHNGLDDAGQQQLDGTLKLPKAPFQLFPGPYGGVETNMAVSDGTVYAAVVNLPGNVNTPADLNKPVQDVDFTKGTGEIVALDLDTGKQKWSTKLETMPFGAITVSNDLAFTTTFDGKVRAFSLEDGKEVWSAELGTPTNAPLTIVGDRLITAASFPQGKGQIAKLVVFQLDGTPVTPPAPAPAATDEPAKTETTTEDDAAKGTVVEVGVESGELKFDKTALTAPAGKVTFHFTNPDTMPHNIAVRQGNDIIAESDLITEGDVELTVDLKKGSYEFICTPHVAAGMKGDLTIT